MVLVKVGEHNVSISINGTERVNELISDDTTYNLSESFNTDIDVNGSNVNSFTQSSNSTYDVSVSSTVSGQSTRTYSFSNFSGGFNNKQHLYKHFSNVGVDNEIFVEITHDNTTDARIEFKINGGTVLESQAYNGSSSGTFTLNDDDDLSIEANEGGGDGFIEFTTFSSTSASANGVNKF